jgi:ribosomal protein L11 methylase PrmA
MVMLSDVLLILLAGAAVALVIILITSSATNAPYLPSDRRSVETMVALADIRPGETTADLGSGDGRVVMAMAEAGAEAHGYEINPILVLWSRREIRRKNLSGKAFIHWKSFWPVNLGRFDAVTMFTLPYFMPRLEKKIKAELRPGARFVSNGSRLPTLPHTIKDEKGGIYLYKE